MHNIIIKNCLICGKEFEGIKVSKYCSSKCNAAAYYQRNKEKIKQNVREWEKKNPEKRKANAKKATDKFRKNKPERFNELMRNYQKNNRGKQASRTKTKRFFDEISRCTKCGKKENLEIHHEIYPTRKLEILKAIKDKKIYYLCRDCHGRRDHHIKINKDKGGTK